MATTETFRKVRLVLWGAVAAVALAGGALLLGEAQRAQQAGSNLPAAATIGAPFTLTRSDGTRFDSQSLAGKPYAIFFGFTNCPDICPTTLLEMSNHLKQLGANADKLNVLFISVDPSRDTPEHLKLYLSAFDDRIIGLTGTTDEVAAVAKSYRIVYEKVPSKDGSDYTMNHTASVYLMNANGRLVSTLSFQEPEETRQRKIDNLVAG
ncbi:MAG: SCO family protein [Hyphomicrobiaceae bacterium]|nr:SCO family protein [Hyphomicrobiaceae bacterium]